MLATSNNDYDLILVTTHQDNLHIYELIKSVEDYNRTLKVLLLVLSQKCKVTFSSSNSMVTLVAIEDIKMSLSAARNTVLRYLDIKDINSTYIMFPDDDSTFDRTFFTNFKKILKSDRCFLSPIYKQGTKDLYLGNEVNENQIISVNDHHLIGSPNQIVPYNLFKEQIWFNEDLGVGAKYGSCEDFDLFLRLNLVGCTYYYTSSIYSFHPAKEMSVTNLSVKKVLGRYRSYSSGFVYIIYTYKKFRFIPMFLFRCIGAAFVSLLKLQFKMALMYFCLLFVRIVLLYKKRYLYNV